MLPQFPSIEVARRAFDIYARLDPRLNSLWSICQCAAPPERAIGEVDDVFDVDPFERDPLAMDKPDDGWCAEDFFGEKVKPALNALVGSLRREDPADLQTEDAFHEVYSLLFNHALRRPCACCCEGRSARSARRARRA